MELVELPQVTMTVSCSKGTYIRTLCHDIGASLGCGGCMEQLIRTRVERFSIEDSLTLSEVETRMREGRIREAVVPVDEMFSAYPAYVSANAELDKLLSNGNTFPENLAEDLPKPENVPEPWIRIYDSGNRFIGIYEYHEDAGRWKPKKIFLGGD